MIDCCRKLALVKEKKNFNPELTAVAVFIVERSAFVGYQC